MKFPVMTILVGFFSRDLKPVGEKQYHLEMGLVTRALNAVMQRIRTNSEYLSLLQPQVSWTLTSPIIRLVDEILTIIYKSHSNIN